MQKVQYDLTLDALCASEQRQAPVHHNRKVRRASYGSGHPFIPFPRLETRYNVSSDSVCHDASLAFNSRQSAPDAPQECPRLASLAVNTNIVSDQAIPFQSRATQHRTTCASDINRGVQKLTVSGLSEGWTRAPSKRKRTVAGCFPCRSQKASMSFFSAVVRLILKKTSLWLSVTLILRCSEAGGSSGLPAPAPAPAPAPPGEASWSDIVRTCVERISGQKCGVTGDKRRQRGWAANRNLDWFPNCKKPLDNLIDKLDA